MAVVKSTGLLLRKVSFSESSLIFKAFTREAGVVTFMAKGAKRANSRYRGILDYFNLLQFVYSDHAKSDIQVVREASLLEAYTAIKEDWERQALANVLLEIVLRYMQEGGPAEPVYQLLQEKLERLDAPDFHPRDASGHLCDFLLSYAAISGFSPRFDACVFCNDPVRGPRVGLDLAQGGPVCDACQAREHASVLPVREGLLRWLERVQALGENAGHLGRAEEQQAETLLLQFVGRHAGEEKKLKSMELYRPVP